MYQWNHCQHRQGDAQLWSHYPDNYSNIICCGKLTKILPSKIKELTSFLHFELLLRFIIDFFPLLAIKLLFGSQINQPRNKKNDKLYCLILYVVSTRGYFVETLPEPNKLESLFNLLDHRGILEGCTPGFTSSLLENKLVSFASWNHLFSISREEKWLSNHSFLFF